jgi:hypothetical protein
MGSEIGIVLNTNANTKFLWAAYLNTGAGYCVAFESDGAAEFRQL